MAKYYLGFFWCFLMVNKLFAQSPEFSTDLTDNQNCGSTTVNFSVNDPTGITSYDWDFGNGEPNGSGPAAGTTYINPGNYIVTLTINDGFDTSQQTIDIFAPPQPSFTILNGTETGCVNGSFVVDFDYTGTVPDFGAEITQWTWDFGDSKPPITLLASNGEDGDISYTYGEYGNYNIIVDVLDANGCEETYFLPQAVRLYPTPTADFTLDYEDETCNFPLTLEFSDQSSDPNNSINLYDWTITDLSNGVVVGSSTDQNPDIELNSAGDYEVKLEVQNSPGGCIDEKAVQLFFPNHTTAFSVNTTTTCLGNEVQFTDESIDGLGGTPLSYEWDFGDGQGSNDSNPTHTYANSAGSPYTVSLKVTFSNACTEILTKTDFININEAPEPVFTSNKDELCDISAIEFTAPTGAAQYSWDFNYDGISPDFDKVTSSNIVNHFYLQEGDFDVFLETETADGCKSSYAISSAPGSPTIKVSFPSPAFSITGLEGCLLPTPETADFDASSSSNLYPTGSNAITNYIWDFNDDGLDIIDNGNNPLINDIEFESEGKFDVKLTIITETGCERSIIYEDTIQRGYAPQAFFDLTQPNECINTAITVTNTSIPNDISSSDIDSLVWDWGDGSTTQGLPSQISIANHTYDDDTEDGTPPGGYQVTLTAYSNGCPGISAPQTVNISYPVARFSYPDLGQCYPGTSIDFDATSSEGVDRYRWDMGDGTLIPGPTVDDWIEKSDPTLSEYKFTRLDDFVVTLYVQNGTGMELCEDSFSEIVPVTFTVPEFLTTATSACQNDTEVQFVNRSLTSNSSPTYSWDFGVDAEPATFEGETPPPVLYSSTGLKTITLELDEGNGCGIKSITREEYVDVRGPIAEFEITHSNATAGYQCLSPLQFIQFTSTSSTETSNQNPDDNENPIVEWFWEFGPGAVPNTIDAFDEDPINVRYTTAGTKTVKLTVTDSEGCTNTIIKSDEIIIPNPQASFELAGGIQCINNNVTINNTSTTAGLSPITSYQWTTDADGTIEFPTAENPGNIVYTTPGTKTLSLEITNDKGCTDEYSGEIEIYFADAQFTNNGDGGCAPATINFFDISDPGANIVSWAWNFDDQIGKEQVNTIGSSTERNPTYTYFYPGVYSVTLTTTSAGGCEITSDPQIVVVDGPSFSAYDVSVGNACLGDDVSEIPVDFTIIGLSKTKFLRIDFGDGSPIFEEQFLFENSPPDPYNVSHSYTSYGGFQPKLSLEDNPNNPDACGTFIFASEDLVIDISQDPVPSFESNTVDNETCQGIEVSFTDKTQDSGGLIDDRYAITDWLWDFGDGASSVEKNPKHTYTATGTFQVSLSITTEAGCMGTTIIPYDVLSPVSDPTPETNLDECASDATLLDAQPAVGGSGMYTYLWEVSDNESNWSPASETNDEEDYTIPARDPSNQITQYYRRSTFSANCQITGATFTVDTDPITLGGTLSSDQLGCYGNNSGTLNLSDYRGDINQWESSIDNFTSPPSIISETSENYSYSNLTTTTYFRVQVQSGVCDFDYSNTVTITVQDEITDNIITSADFDQCSEDALLEIEGDAPSGGEGNFSYQWQSSEDNSNFTNISGATTQNYTPDELIVTTYFKRLVTSDGAIDCTDESNVHTYNITTSPDLSINYSTKNNVCEDDNLEIDFEDSQDGYTYEVLDLDNSSNIVATATGTGNAMTITVLDAALPNGETTFNFQIRIFVDKVISGICEEFHPIDQVNINAIPDEMLEVNDGGAVCSGNDATITIEDTQIGYEYRVQDRNNDNNTVATGIGNGGQLMITVLSNVLPTEGNFEYRIRVKNEACSINLDDMGSFAIIPIPDQTMEVTDPFVCEEGLLAHPTIGITIRNSELNVAYSIREDLGNTIVAGPEPGVDGDLTINISTPSATTLYNVIATPIPLDGQSNQCTDVEIDDKSTVTIIPIPTTNYSVSDPIICEEIGKANIDISGSEINVKYTIREIGETDPADGDLTVIIGDGNPITFSVNTIIDQDFEVVAQSMITSDFGSCDEFLFPDIAEVIVIPEPNTSISDDLLVNDFNYCEEDAGTIGNLIFSVAATQTNVEYALVEAGGDPLAATPVEGTGGVINFSPVPAPTVTTIFEVYARSTLPADAGLCDYFKLEDEGEVIVAPIPDLTLNVSDPEICIGDSGEIIVANSELEVNYQLAYNATDILVGLPKAGNGGDLSFDISIVENTVFKVFATSLLAPACDTYTITDTGTATIVAEPDLDVPFTTPQKEYCEGDEVIFSISTQDQITYQPLKNNTIFGSPIAGDGNVQMFSDFPTESAVYSVLATPTEVNSEGVKCSSFPLETVIGITVIGPFDWITQPNDVVVCDNSSVATFTAQVDNQGDGGNPELQWYFDEPAGDAIFDPVSGGDFSGENTETLILNTGGSNLNSYDGYRFYLEGSINSCITQSQIAELSTELSPDITDLIIDAADICFNQNVTVDISGTGLIDGAYLITYEVVGSNPIAQQTESVTISSGTTQIILPASNISNVGSSEFIINQLEYDFGKGCTVVPPTVISDNFIVFPSPNTSSLGVSAQDNCVNNEVAVEIISQLISADYEFIYNVTGVNNATDQSSGTVSIIDGNGSFSAPASIFTLSGNSVVTIKQVRFDDFLSGPDGCRVSDLNVNTSVATISAPDIATPLLSDIDVCTGNSASLTLSDSELNVSYQLRNDSDDSPVGNPVLGNGGDILFFITPTENTTYNVLATSSLIEGTCESLELTDFGSVTLIPIPDVTLNVSADQNTACFGDKITITVFDSEPNVEYSLQVDEIAGANFPETFNVIGTGSDIEFTNVPTVTSVYTVIATPLTQDYTTNLCSSVQLNEVISIEVEGPILINQQPSNLVLCDDSEIALFQAIVDNEGDGGTPNFQWQASADGILYTDINDGVIYSGTSTTTLIVDDYSAIDLEYYKLLIETDFCSLETDPATLEIKDLPITDGITLDAADICAGENLNVSINSGLLDGTYAIEYNVTGSNNGGPYTDGIIVNDGLGNASFEISKDKIATPGTTVVTLIELNFFDGQQCGVYGLTASTVVDIDNNPDIGGIELSIDEICSGSDAMINFRGSLLDGDYNVNYDLSGANIGSYSEALSILGGIGQLTVPSAQLTTDGTTGIKIQSIQFVDGELCLSDIPPESGNSEIIIHPDPIISSEMLSAEVLCYGDSLNIILTEAQEFVDYYILRSDLVAVSDTLSSLDEISDELIFSITPNPIADTEYRLWAYANQAAESCSPVDFMPINISVTEQPETGYDLIVSDNSVCHGESITISLDNTDPFMSYQLQANKVDVAGQVIQGLSGPQAFPSMETPGTSTNYRVTITPYIDGSVTSCDTELLDDSEIVVVEGPVTFLSQPSDITACQPAGPDIYVVSMMAEVNTVIQGVLSLQWEVSTDGVNFDPILASNTDYDNEDQQTLLINLTSSNSLNGNYYRLSASTNECASEESNTAMLTVTSIPDVSDFTLSSISDICNGQDASVSFTSTSMSDGSYIIQYSIIHPSAPTTTSFVNIDFMGDNGNFSIPASELVEDGSHTVDILNIGFSPYADCHVGVAGGSDSFIVETVPDGVGLAVSINDICDDGDATVAITGAPASSAVTITYNMSGPVNLTGLQENINTDGSGADNFIISNATLSQPGQYTLTITAIENTSTLSCGTSGLNVADDFYKLPQPDLNSPQLTDVLFCQGNEFDIVMTNSQLNVTYELFEDDESSTTGIIVLGTGSTVTFENVPTHSGTEIYKVQAVASASLLPGCTAQFITSTSTTTEIPTPVAYDVSVDDANICVGDPVTVTLSNSQNNVWYMLTNLDSDTLGVTNGNTGNPINFVRYPESNVTYAILALPNIQDSENEYCTPFSIMTNTPTVDVQGPLQIDSQPSDFYACTEDAVFSVSASDQNNSEFSYSYQWYEGMNMLSNTGDYSGVLTDELTVTNPQDHDLEVYSVVINSTNGCSITSEEVTLYSQFEINLDDFEVSSSNICLGEKATVSIAGLLTDDPSPPASTAFDIYYDLSGANIITDLVATVIPDASGNSNFKISRDNLNSAGITIVTAKEIRYSGGIGCSTGPISISTAFIVQPLPDISILSIDASDICEGQESVVDVTSSLINADYLFDYDLTSSMGTSKYQAEVLVNSDNGSTTFNIPVDQTTEPGSYTLDITAVTFANGENCTSLISPAVSTTFNRQLLPITDGIFIETNNICQGDSLTVDISSMMTEGDYEITYFAYGANASTNTETISVANDGSSSFYVGSEYLQADGEMYVSIVNISHVTGEMCATKNINITDNFVIEDLPVESGIELFVTDVCQGKNSSSLLTSNLVDGDYNAVYDIYGANISFGGTVSGSVASGNGNISAEIPGSLFPNPGLTTVQIREISFAEGLGCKIEPQDLAQSLNVEAEPDVTGMIISIEDHCFGDDVSVEVTGSNLAEGSYEVNYFLIGLTTLLEEKTVISTVDGSFEFNISADLFNNPETYILKIVNVANTEGLECDVTIFDQSETFTVNPLPNLDDLALTVVSPICRNVSTSASISGLLPNTDYEIFYEISEEDLSGLTLYFQQVTTDLTGTTGLVLPALQTTSYLNIIAVSFNDGATYCSSTANLDPAEIKVGCNPISADATVTGIEDNLTVFSDEDFYFEDPDGDGFDGIVLTSLPVKGLLFYRGVILTPNDVASGSSFADGNLFRYFPSFDGNGAPFDSFTFKVKDDSDDPDTEHSLNDYTMSINIEKTDDAPELSDFSKTTDEEVSLDFTDEDFTLNYEDIEDEPLVMLRIASLPDPSAGALQLNGIGVSLNQEFPIDEANNLTFVPVINFFGIAVFQWNANDGELWATEPANVAINVDPINDAPVAVDDAATVNGTTTLTGSVATNDSDIEGDPLLYLLINGPSFGVGTIDESGIFSYTANQGYNGYDTMRYVVTDVPPSPLTALRDTAELIISVTAIFLDSDNDGIFDYIEVGEDPDNPIDTDQDGSPDYLDKDADNDGIADSFEYKEVDISGGGIDDARIFLNLIPLDNDGDGIANYLDTDSDNDGVLDVEESGNIPPLGIDENMNGIDDAYDNPDGEFDNSLSRDPRDSDNDGEADFIDFDDDNDGLATVFEDLDDDGYPVNDDTDGNGIPNYLDNDDDGDSILTAEEDVDQDGNPTDDDTDENDIPNYLDNDDDGDFVLTINEDINANGLLIIETFPWFNEDGSWAGSNGDPTDDDTDQDGIPNYLDSDDDGDGISTKMEDINGNLNPSDDDSDGDTKPDYLDNSDDEDGDGIPDIEECDQTGSGSEQGLFCDCDGDGIPNFIDAFDDCDGALLVIPNVFTPNGDRSNDLWMIPLITEPIYANNQVMIFNRWGTKVFEGTNYDNANVVFDGRSNTGLASTGNELPDGTYFYFITIEGQSEKLSGYVVIKR